MVLNLPFLLLGIVLLWFPRRWMRFGVVLGRRKRRSRRGDEPWIRREPGDPRVNFWREIHKPRNYFDFFRAAAGGLAIVGGDHISPRLPLSEGGGDFSTLLLLAAMLTLLVGILIQVYRNENGRMAFFAPIFYLAGLSVCLVGTWGAVFAFALIWAVNPVFGNPQAFLAVYGVVVAAFGLVLRDVPIERPITALSFFLLPVLLSLMTGRPLIVFSRKGFHVHEDR